MLSLLIRVSVAVRPEIEELGSLRLTVPTAGERHRRGGDGQGGGVAAGADLDATLVVQIAGEMGGLAAVHRISRTRGDGHAVERGVVDAVDGGTRGAGEVAAVDR